MYINASVYFITSVRHCENRDVFWILHRVNDHHKFKKDKFSISEELLKTLVKSSHIIFSLLVFVRHTALIHVHENLLIIYLLLDDACIKVHLH